MDLRRDGARFYPAALDAADLLALDEALAAFAPDRPGTRLAGNPALVRLLATDRPIGRLAADLLGPHCRPVRAILFNKTPGQNWSLGWHQDRTIAVRRPADVTGYGPWTVKAGLNHVEPPFALLEHMLTFRIHLDQVDEANAPLLIAPGSHLLGRIPESAITDIVQRLGTHACLAERGDIRVYATPILHASDAARSPRSRRVLQIDYSADQLPPPLEWLGI